MKRALRRIAAALVAAASVAGSAQAEDGAPLRVFAAASLAEPFRALEPIWKQRHAATPLQLQLAASSALAVQIEEGAPADVVATADERTMRRLEDAGRVETPRPFARGVLTLAVEKGNPKRIAGLADLARDDLVVVLAAPEVPAGRYARDLLAGAGVTAQPRSLEENVKAVLQKVALGEADAGIVYASDVRAAADRVEAIPLPEAAKIPVTYWIAPLAASAQPAQGRAFVALVLDAEGRAALTQAGFTPP